MDPNVAYQSWLEAIDDEDVDLEEVFELWNSLAEWLGRGGFHPDWPLEAQDEFYEWAELTLHKYDERYATLTFEKAGS